jgi:uncharacterized protein YdaU (DUF1376 family)
MTNTPKRLPAFAFEMLTNHPLALTLPAAAFGMLCRLIFHYIMTECRPIPPDGDNLRGIMRCHRSTWTEHKTDILAVFQDLAPKLEHANQSYQNRLANVRELGKRGNVTTRLKAHGKKQARPNADSALAIRAPKRERTAPITRPLTQSDSAWRE